MLNAFGRLEQFRGESPFWAWLRQIVANTALMRLRARKRLASLETAFPEDDDLMGDAGMAPIHAAEFGALERAMTELPAITRSVIWLYCVEGYSHAEIAESMAQSISFSKSQLARGLARLRRLLNVEEMSHAGYA